MSILDDMYKTIEDRKVNPKEKSYTNYLLNEGIDKVCKKVGEESAETIIAAKNEDKSELIGEICDLTYHVLVLMNLKGVTLKEVEDKLIQRHGVECNKKEFNIRGEY